jgi:hypothetical protein
MEQSHTAFAERLDDAEPAPPPPAAEEAMPEPAEAAAAAPPAESPALSAIQQDVSELTRDLATFASSMTGLVERVERLERALAEASADLGQLAEAARGPAAQPLRDLGGLIGELEAAGGSERLGPLIELLDNLTANPRDIELLLKLSQQTDTLQQVLRLQTRLAEVGPMTRDALRRIVGPAPS